MSEGHREKKKEMSKTSFKAKLTMLVINEDVSLLMENIRRCQIKRENILVLYYCILFIISTPLRLLYRRNTVDVTYKDKSWILHSPHRHSHQIHNLKAIKMYLYVGEKKDSELLSRSVMEKNDEVLPF